MLQLILAILLAAGGAQSTWYEHYENGVRLIADGHGAEARAELEAAIAMRGSEGLQIATRQQQYIDYLPHLYLAIASQMSGDVAAARKELARAEDTGVAAKSEVGRPLLIAYQLLLRGDGSSSRPAYATFKQTTPLLSEQEFSVLRNDVLTKCDVAPDMKLADAPWYARYELGLELERKGDYGRALNEFVDAVANRPNPQRRARTYGMWLVDYYPYFHIARSHVRLQNWQCAKNALDISQRLGEIPQGAPELSEYLTLQQETARHLEH